MVQLSQLQQVRDTVTPEKQFAFVETLLQDRKVKWQQGVATLC